MGLGATLLGGIEPEANADALECVDAGDGLGNAPIEFAVPLHVGAETEGSAGDAHLDLPAEGIAVGLGGVDGGDHLLGGGGVGATHAVTFDSFPIDILTDLGAHAADGEGVAVEGNAELVEEALGDTGDGNAGGSLAGAGALEDVADVVEAVLDGAGQVGVAGAETGDALDLGVDGLNRHLLGPVHPVAVRDPEGDGGTEGESVADAGGDLGAVLLDLHAAAAAVAALAAGHVAGNVVLGEGQARGQALDEGGEALAVTFAGGEEAETAHQEACLSVPSPGEVGMGARVMGAARPPAVVSQAVSKRASISAGARSSQSMPSASAR